MKNNELWKSYDFYTSELTKHSRHLAFAAVAICWFFKSAELSFPTPILVSLILLVCFFAFDILQYFASAHLIRWWTRREEKIMWKNEKTIEGDYPKPWWLDSPAFIFFNLKSILLISSFFAIGIEFLQHI